MSTPAARRAIMHQVRSWLTSWPGMRDVLASIPTQPASVPSLPSCETQPAPRITVIRGEPICWGIKDHYVTAPVLNLPEGVVQVRRRLRPNQPARIYLRYSDRIEVWLAQDHPAGLHLKLRQGINAQADL